MKQHQGIWLPDHEKHLIGWMDKGGELVDGRGTYQIKKLRAAVAHAPTRRVALDVGGHVGFWSMQLAKEFGIVHAFEPMATHRECFRLNTAHLDNIVLHECALGSRPGRVRLVTEDGSSGNTHVDSEVGDESDWDGSVAMLTIDSFGFEDVDFVKIDCEGYEVHVIEGARETLLRCRPCVIVEQKERVLRENYGIKGAPAVALLESMGARVHKVMSGDYILAWN